jgi:hypothetical protein
MAATKKMPGGGWGAGTGRGTMDCFKDTTAWCKRQLVKIALPWIAAIITSTRYTDRKSRFLDRLLVMAEGGGDGV